jgi:hypothetical protein
MLDKTLKVFLAYSSLIGHNPPHPHPSLNGVQQDIIESI